MWEAIANNAVLTTSVLVFVAVILLLEALYLYWKAKRGPQARQLEKRLKSFTEAPDAKHRAPLLKERKLSDVPMIERFLAGMPRAEGLQTFIHQADLKWTVSRLLLSCVVFGAFTFFALTWLGGQSMLFGAMVGLAVAALPVLYVNTRRNRRLARIEQQLPDAIDLMIRALRAGHAFSSALKMAGDEMAEPIANEFRIVHDEVNFGVSMQQALMNMSHRIPLTDMRYFVVAVLIQRDSGGNLSEVLGGLSRLIRDRLKFNAKVRVLSSEGRLSAWVLGLLPFALAGLMYMANPKFMSPLWTDPIGISIIKYMLIMMAFGVFVLTRITKIRV
jgi:tight adherence protein B